MNFDTKLYDWLKRLDIIANEMHKESDSLKDYDDLENIPHTLFQIIWKINCEIDTLEIVVSEIKQYDRVLDIHQNQLDYFSRLILTLMWETEKETIKANNRCANIRQEIKKIKAGKSEWFKKL